MAGGDDHFIPFHFMSFDDSLIFYFETCESFALRLLLFNSLNFISFWIPFSIHRLMITHFIYYFIFQIIIVNRIDLWTHKHKRDIVNCLTCGVSLMTKYGYEKWTHMRFHFANCAFAKMFLFLFEFFFVSGFCLHLLWQLSPDSRNTGRKELHCGEQEAVLFLSNFTLSPLVLYRMNEQLRVKKEFKRLIDGYFWNTFEWDKKKEIFSPFLLLMMINSLLGQRR